MKSLDEAWAWYQDARRGLSLLRRLGSRYWDQFPWEGPLGSDDRIRPQEGFEVVGVANRAIVPLDDLAVLVLFSVFEGMVRERLKAEIRHHRGLIGESRVAAILDDSLDAIENGSFYRVLGLFKPADHDLVEKANQVRRYRNWVAHGKRGKQPKLVEPEEAYRRLCRLLATLDETGPDPDDEAGPPSALA